MPHGLCRAPSVKTQEEWAVQTSETVIHLMALNYFFWENPLLGSSLYRFHLFLALNFPAKSLTAKLPAEA